MAGKSKKQDALRLLSRYLESAKTSEVRLTDSALSGEARIGRTTLYEYIKNVPGLEGQIAAARAEQERFLGDSPIGRNRRRVRERIAGLEAQNAALEAANRALLVAQASFVDALRGPACRVPAEKIQRAMNMSLTEADRSLSGSGRRRKRFPKAK
jgi:hypothetical protein